MTSTCQIVPFPREGRSSSRDALRGVKCKSMSNRSKTNPTRPRKRLLHRSGSVTAGRSHGLADNNIVMVHHGEKDGILPIIAHKSARGSGRKLTAHKQMASSKLVFSMMLIMLSMAQGSDLLSVCQIKWKELERMIRYKQIPACASRMEEVFDTSIQSIVGKWRGHYTDVKGCQACINDGTMHFFVNQRIRMEEGTEYKVRFLPTNSNDSILVITAKDIKGGEWLIAPFECNGRVLINNKWEDRNAMLVFVRLCDLKYFHYSFSEPLTEKEKKDTMRPTEELESITGSDGSTMSCNAESDTSGTRSSNGKEEPSPRTPRSTRRGRRRSEKSQREIERLFESAKCNVPVEERVRGIAGIMESAMAGGGIPVEHSDLTEQEQMDYVWDGKLIRTESGLTINDLMLNRYGRIIRKC